MPINNAVFVIGYDYDKKGLTFETYASNRMQMLLKQDKKLKVTVFNVGSGAVRLSQIDSDKKVRVWKDLDQFHFKSVTEANYTVTISDDGRKHYEFNKKQKGVMSIVDVYAYIQKLGKQEPGTLIEVSFFSHGWISGPILVNSDDNAPDTDPHDPNKHPRDENDKDARADKDFLPPTMDTESLQLFQKAFAPTAAIWVWGCAFTTSYFQVLYKLFHSPIYQKTPLDKLSDETSIHFSFTKKQSEDFFSDDTQFFPRKHKKDAKHKEDYYPLEFDRTFAEVKAFFTRGLADTYSQHIANAAKVKTFGALLGTYADGEEKVPLPIMRIPNAVPPYADNFIRYIEFYKKFLKIALDPENRGYGTYLPLSLRNNKINEK